MLREKMGIKKQSSPEKTSETGNPYFEVQASWGMTKHMGGLKATEQLVELCHIKQGKYVLVVGCGVGVTPCYLAERYGCKVVGVDLSEKMVGRSKERARRKGIEDKVEFRVADAQDLPFEDAIFDAIICESVNAFVENKPGALSEYVRVIKPGGYAGINEVTWLKTPPEELVSYLYRIMGAEFLTSSGWKELLDDSGLKDTAALVFKTNAVSQWTGEVRQFELSDFIKAWCRYCYMVIKSPAARKFTREALSFPRSIFRLFEYFGYGLYAGRK
ncbi:MAG: class I SAM-dependent methyltransferase [Chloroflexota bacterium]